jgi:hypothetical protein
VAFDIQSVCLSVGRPSKNRIQEVGLVGILVVESIGKTHLDLLDLASLLWETSEE